VRQAIPQVTAMLLSAWAMAAAGVASCEPVTADSGPWVALTAGRFNIEDPSEGPTGGGAEYLWAPLDRWKLIPSVGFTLANGGVAYGYAALRYDFHLGGSWRAAPVFGAGLFSKGGDVDLGHSVQFKTGIELSARVADRYRVGLLFYHLSNAGLSDDNPGVEVLEVVFGIPAGR
jgi:lipid A 3-O-deacylase